MRKAFLIAFSFVSIYNLGNVLWQSQKGACRPADRRRQMNIMHYKTKGTCSQYIDFDLEDGIIRNLEFAGGCNGNLKGISKLVEGMKAEEVMEKLQGTTCGFKDTSCPDQLARALKQALAQ